MAAKGMEYFWNLSSILLLGKFFLFIKKFLLKKKKKFVEYIIRISIFLLKCHLPLSKSCEYVKLLYIFFFILKIQFGKKLLKNRKNMRCFGEICVFSILLRGGSAFFKHFWIESRQKYICHIDSYLLAGQIYLVTSLGFIESLIGEIYYLFIDQLMVAVMLVRNMDEYKLISGAVTGLR